MCVVALPAIAAYAALATAAVGAGASAYSSIQQGNYQAAVAKNNQLIADNNARNAQQAGIAAVTASQLKSAQEVANARARAGGAGIDPNFGSPVDLQSDTAKLGALDALTIKSNYEKVAAGYQSQANVYGADAQMDKIAGQNSAVGSILSGASSVGSKYADYRSVGLLS